jgi:hypothetical protein
MYIYISTRTEEEKKKKEEEEFRHPTPSLELQDWRLSRKHPAKR